jgi:hypothetical protein
VDPTSSASAGLTLDALRALARSLRRGPALPPDVLDVGLHCSEFAPRDQVFLVRVNPVLPWLLLHPDTWRALRQAHPDLPEAALIRRLAALVLTTPPPTVSPHTPL